ncbi:histidine phosphatase family protein [Mangrovibacterium marinum]|uniref:Phosphohistidine phosphatase n=1 Tax=Mangrovibacterium marinum TaxID=1639118 RepID=A0A2T5BYA2_9BACT|nr:histidine phosphatase family protein [Mangrovibacterium marinum]PTN06780.1 phosphohistidine phosphatase [Mangrovibacterium marinum]
MKRVVIVRHAKAVPYGYDDDFNRKLRDSGKEDAALLSEKLKELYVSPDLIIASPAKRAYKTAKIYAETYGYAKENIQKDEDLYDGLTTMDFIDMLHTLPAEMETVFVFGHNPTVHYLVNNLVRFFNSDTPTCSTAVIEFEVDRWNQISSREGKLTMHLKPRNYR